MGPCVPLQLCRGWHGELEVELRWNRFRRTTVQFKAQRRGISWELIARVYAGIVGSAAANDRPLNSKYLLSEADAVSLLLRLGRPAVLSSKGLEHAPAAPRRQRRLRHQAKTSGKSGGSLRRRQGSCCASRHLLSCVQRQAMTPMSLIRLLKATSSRQPAALTSLFRPQKEVGCSFGFPWRID